MASMEELGDRIDGANDMRSVVHTMKTLSAVTIRQYEQAVAGLREYAKTIEMGLRIALHDGRIIHKSVELTEPVRPLFVVFGSDQGLAGRFNDVIVDHMEEYLDVKMPEGSQAPAVLSVGMRVRDGLRERGHEPVAHVPMPGSLASIREAVQEVVDGVLKARNAGHVNAVYLFHNRSVSHASFEPRHRRILPVDVRLLKDMAAMDWPTRQVPDYRMSQDELFTDLVESWLFVVLFVAFVESGAAEHAARLAAMQAAEKNIDERLDELNKEYRRARQEQITGEMLDIVGGFEALNK